MKTEKCGAPNCGRYILEEESTQVFINGKMVSICEVCDDGSYNTLNKMGGNHHETYNKVEKIKRKRNKTNN